MQRMDVSGKARGPCGNNGDGGDHGATAMPWLSRTRKRSRRRFDLLLYFTTSSWPANYIWNCVVSKSLRQVFSNLRCLRMRDISIRVTALGNWRTLDSLTAHHVLVAEWLRKNCVISFKTTFTLQIYSKRLRSTSKHLRNPHLDHTVTVARNLWTSELSFSLKTIDREDRWSFGQKIEIIGVIWIFWCVKDHFSDLWSTI